MYLIVFSLKGVGDVDKNENFICDISTSITMLVFNPEFLSPCDLANVSLVNKYWSSQITSREIKQQLEKTIKQRLKSAFKNHYETFKYYMKSAGAVISGSFILQCFYSENWSPSDLDIYVHDTGNFRENPLIKFLSEFSETWPRFYHNYARDHIGVRSFNSETVNYMHISEITDICGIGNIQIINISHTDIHQFIRETFDMSVLKNMFSYDHKFEVGNLDEIFHKKSQIKFDENIALKTLGRYLKYSARGFTFYDFQLTPGLIRDRRQLDNINRHNIIDILQRHFRNGQERYISTRYHSETVII